MIDLTRSRGISGVPVVLGTQVVGIVTHRDLRFETKLDAPVISVMTPKERLITVRENAPKEEVLALLHKHRIEKVLVVAGDHELNGMITVKDFQKATEFPSACKDTVGAACRRRRGYGAGYPRAGGGAARSGRRRRGGGYLARAFARRARDGRQRSRRPTRICRSSAATSSPPRLRSTWSSTEPTP